MSIHVSHFAPLSGPQTGRMKSSDTFESNKPKSGKLRGFAGMDPERQREIASMGGITAHRKGTAHTWDSEAAREAGRKGGEARARNRLSKLRGPQPDIKS